MSMWDPESTEPEAPQDTQVTDAEPVEAEVQTEGESTDTGDAEPVEAEVQSDDGDATPDATPDGEATPDGDSESTPEAGKLDAAGNEKQRRPKGWLANDVQTFIQKAEAGEITVDGALTPHRVAKGVQKMDDLEAPPSTGAVSAVFARWDAYGIAEFTDKPRAFANWTDKGRDLGLVGVLDERREARKQAREAAKAAEKAAAPAATDGNTDTAAASSAPAYGESFQSGVPAEAEGTGDSDAGGDAEGVYDPATPETASLPQSDDEVAYAGER